MRRKEAQEGWTAAQQVKLVGSAVDSHVDKNLEDDQKKREISS